MWWMTLRNNKAPPLCHFKLYALFCTDLWIQTGVIAWKCWIQVKIMDFSTCVTLKFDGWPRKNGRACLLCHFKFMHHFVSICEFKLELVWKCPNHGKICFDLCDLDLLSLTSTFGMDITFVKGNNSWKFHDDAIAGTLWKMCHRPTDRTVLRAAWSQPKIWEWYSTEILPKLQCFHSREMW